MTEAVQPLAVLYPHEHVGDSEDGADEPSAPAAGRLPTCASCCVTPKGRGAAGRGGRGHAGARGRGRGDAVAPPRGCMAEVVRDGWFYTGDLGRFDAQGYLHIVGRNKDMIISGGFNVYAREVEDALAEPPRGAGGRRAGPARCPSGAKWWPRPWCCAPAPAPRPKLQALLRHAHRRLQEAAARGLCARPCRATWRRQGGEGRTARLLRRLKPRAAAVAGRKLTPSPGGGPARRSGDRHVPGQQRCGLAGRLVAALPASCISVLTSPRSSACTACFHSCTER
jgi:hypothetical protein